VAEPHAEPVLLAIEAGIASITLNRPRRLNAITEEMHAALRSTFDTIERDERVRAVILTGAGAAFCAGQDLNERTADCSTENSPDLSASLSENYHPLLRRIVELPVPVIAAVNGVAVGAGASLAVACDVVLAAKSAEFRFSFVRIGLGLDCGAAWLLPRLIGQARALALSLTGEPIGADEAERIGLIWKSMDDELLKDEALQLAGRFSSSSIRALTAVKRQIRAAGSTTFEQALAFERDSQALLGQTSEYREAVTRFANRGKSGPGEISNEAVQ
jgi:2-(1,2-epoxy-1,2-dihydrophenyl)acetyl-CoA isomerase